MAIAFDAAANSVTINGPSSVSLVITPAGVNRVMGIGVFHDNPSTISSITVNGVAATFVRANTAGSGSYTNELYYIIAPATGLITVTCTFTGAAFGSMCALNLTGCKQSLQPNAHGGVNAASAASATAPYTSTIAPTWAIGFFEANQGSALGVGANTTSRAQLNDGVFGYSIMITSTSADQTPAGAFSQIGTWGSTGCGGVAMAITDVDAVAAITRRTIHGIIR